MPTLLLRTLLPASVLALACGSAAAAVAIGPDFQVNTEVAGTQGGASVGVDPAGNFLIAWTSDGQDGSGAGVFAQRFDASGARVGAEFRANKTTNGDQKDVAVSMGVDGTSLIAWTGIATSGGGTDVFVRRYNASGSPVAPESSLSGLGGGNGNLPALAQDASGNFVAAWQGAIPGTGTGIVARRFDPVGNPLGAAFLVKTNCCALSNIAPRVAMNADGAFVVAWSTNSTDPDAIDVYARAYDSAGHARAAPFRVNTFTTDRQTAPDVAIDDAGAFVVAWQSNNQDGGFNGIYAQRYTAAGARAGGEFRVNVNGAGGQVSPIVAKSADGSFMIGWLGPDDTVGSGSEGLNVAHFAAGGARGAAQYFAGNDYAAPALARQASGDFVVAGTVIDEIRAQRFADDFVPGAFNFTNRSGVRTGRPARSNVVTIADINVPAPISIAKGGQYSVNAGSFTGMPGTVSAGDTVQLQQVASDQPSATKTTKVTIGGVSDSWSLTTGTADTTPNSYNFPDVTNAPTSSVITSAPVTITGINRAVSISMVGDSSRQYSINNGGFVSAAGTIQSGDQVVLRLTSAPGTGISSNVIVTIGGVRNTWTVKTGP